MCNVTKGQSGIQAAAFNKLLGGEKMPQKEKQMEKPEKKGCADAMTVVLVYVQVCLCCFALSRFVNTPRSGQRQHHQQDIYEGFGGLLHPLALLRPPPHLPQCSVLPSVSHSFPCKAGWF